MNFNISKPLSSKELTQEFIKYKNGDKEARNKIISCNARLVIHIVKKYQNTKINLSELFSIGIVGLVKAVDTYDLSKKIKFPSYAGVCINNEILMFLRRNKKHEKEVSLDAPLRIGKDQDEGSFEDLLENPNVNIIEDYEKKESIEEIKKFVSQLPELEREVIYLYFGFYKDREYSQKEIANKTGFSQSYVSRVLKRALKKLKIVMESSSSITDRKSITRVQVLKPIVSNDLIEFDLEVKQPKISQKTEESIEEVVEEPIEEIIEFNEEQLKQLESLKVPTYMEILSNFTPKEAVIVCLGLGFINGKSYSIGEISDFLKINKQEIQEIVLKYLNLYRNNIKQFIDKTVELSNESFVLSKNGNK